jgi:hypothetical protein
MEPDDKIRTFHSPAPSRTLMSRIVAVKHLLDELGSAFPILADTRSRIIWARDLMLFHAMGAGSLSSKDSFSTLKFKGGALVKYALTEGDIDSVRDIMVEQIYRRPPFLKPSVIVDLGANIDLRQYFTIQNMAANL